ncbi:helix-turn-helix domain-containing protein [Actinocorallia sp. A-T 12471]|uniref:helix-turn-helix domain-containing protein n=1 Tax=Actinocorallia sp. A-T 12471 TaxID=3089813 RepID=UPI0029CCA60E|nr:helix-turn-helix domain-containing protein [Actinocorallia sp. A-T 12471]MDX6743658.1 helix-turn-helix domain-containing protein [Actinocorallia sp. A-T 12471]
MVEKTNPQAGGIAPLEGRGIVRPGEMARHVVLERREPGPELAGFAEHHWVVRWRVGEPYDAKVLSHPNVHLVFEPEGAFVYGVDRGVFVRHLTGAGHVLGVKFLPGGFRALYGGPIAELADRRVAAAEIFGASVDAVNTAIQGRSDIADMVADAEGFLVPLLPDAPDPQAGRAAELVARFTAEPSLFRVDDAADAAGLSVRALQRLFSDYVGASPKWVLRRARLHEVAARADAGADIDWPALAAALGYTDQSHLIRDFTATLGQSPTKYTKTP